MAKYSKFGYGEYKDIPNAIEENLVDGRDFIIASDTSELIFINDDLSQRKIKSRIVLFDSTEEAINVINNSPEYYEGEPIAIKNNSDSYQLYIIQKQGNNLTLEAIDKLQWQLI